MKMSNTYAQYPAADARQGYAPDYGVQPSLSMFKVD